MTAPRVFISYSHDSPEHSNRVRHLADQLRTDGADAVIDQYFETPAEGWPRWMEQNLEQADAVLVVCSEQYSRRVTDTEQSNKGLGVKWEGSLIYQTFYAGPMGSVRLIPVVFERSDIKYIPIPLQPSTYYILDTEEGYASLYRRLVQQPAIVKPALGALAQAGPRSRPLHGISVFLCHCSKDKPNIRDLYGKLRRDGAKPWLDEEDLLPGQRWEEVISDAVRKADAVVVCLSKQAVTRAGFFHKEISFALDVLDQQPESAIYLIPVKLENCEIPKRLQHLHCVTISDDKGYDKLVGSLYARASQLNLQGAT